MVECVEYCDDLGSHEPWHLVPLKEADLGGSVCEGAYMIISLFFPLFLSLFIVVCV